MKIYPLKVKPKKMAKLVAGCTAQIRGVGEDKFILIQPSSEYCVDAILDKNNNEVRTSKYVIKDNWIVMDKNGGFRVVPTAALKRVAPERPGPIKWISQIGVTRIIAVVAAIVFVITR